jgi:hypothetical protein
MLSPFRCDLEVRRIRAAEIAADVAEIRERIVAVALRGGVFVVVLAALGGGILTTLGAQIATSLPPGEWKADPCMWRTGPLPPLDRRESSGSALTVRKP